MGGMLRWWGGGMGWRWGCSDRGWKRGEEEGFVWGWLRRVLMPLRGDGRKREASISLPLAQGGGRIDNGSPALTFGITPFSETVEVW